MNKTELVYKGCRNFMHNHDHILQNGYFFNWESDVFGLMASGYSTEIEVKISKSDFKADFIKKEKHFLLKNHKNKHNVSSRDERGGFWIYNDDGKLVKNDFEACLIRFCKTYESIPNRFYYACPDGLISIEDVPDYAGLIYINEKSDPIVIKKAPLLHKNKKDWTKKLLDKYFYRKQNALNNLIYYQYHIDENAPADKVIEFLKNKIKTTINILR